MIQLHALEQLAIDFGRGLDVGGPAAAATRKSSARNGIGFIRRECRRQIAMSSGNNRCNSYI